MFHLYVYANKKHCQILKSVLTVSYKLNPAQEIRQLLLPVTSPA